MNTSESIYSLEDAYVENDEGAPRRSSGGRRREARSMGRYPFLGYAEEYLERRKASLAEESLIMLRRKAILLNEILVDLREEGTISSTSPKKLTENDINNVILWMRGEGHSNGYMVKNLCFLRQICEYAGNGVFAKMQADGIELPKRTPKDLRPLKEEELGIIISKADELKGWSGEVCRFLVNLYPYTGLRPSELRLAQIQDIDIYRWTIWVRHPKGEKRYARQRTVPILPPAREAVRIFLEARKKRLESKGIKSEALIPTSNGDYYSSNSFRKMKAKLEEKVNMDLEGGQISFQLRTFRETFCQESIDRGADTSAVSLIMGHSSTKTTEAFYGRMRTDKALAELNKAWTDVPGESEGLP